MSWKQNGIARAGLRILPIGVLGWAIVGCDAPDIQPISPPGAPMTRKSPDAEPAQAQGEIAAPAQLQTESVTKSIPSAAPTARGEVKTTAGGVKYETLKEGSGAELKPGESGEFLYEGRLENGTVFDGNMKSGTPTGFSLGGVIKGWQEGLPGMKVGERRKLTIPSDMAYGSKGSPPKIPPNATLIFEVELVRLTGQ